MLTPRPHFPAAALTFLRSLARHNNREWFTPRKDAFERDVRAPLVALVEQLDRDFATFAPELVASPKTSIFRIYRDTRFSEDKSPYKTAVSAVFPHRSLAKMQGAGLYVEISGKHVLAAGGVYAPSAPELRAIRGHIAANERRFRSIVEAPAFVRVTGGLTGESLSRMPLGFPPTHSAADLIRMKQFLVWKEWPAALASTPRFYPTLLKVFQASAPLVRFLNEPLVGRGL
ncbi:MAG: DUF2461 domain-containing protein [Vicinamibacterales bacterium]